MQKNRMTYCPTPNPLQILLADDNEANSLIALTILERAGHDVVTARTGYQALELSKLTNFDLIILDVLMPVMDGLQALKLIRQGSSLNQNTLIFALSAFSDTEERERYLAAGFDGTLSKPLRSGDLEIALTNFEIQSTEAQKTPTGTYSLQHVPLIDHDIISLLMKRGSPESLLQIQTRIWNSIHEKCCIIETSLPTVLQGDYTSLSVFRRAIHSIKSTSDSAGLPRVAHISRSLQNSPPSEIRKLMCTFVTALTESHPAYSLALFRARELDTAMQMRGEDQAEPAHDGQNYSSAVGY